MFESLLPLTPWHWLIASLTLIGIEMIFFGAYFFLSCGLAAAALAIVVFFMPTLSWEIQGALFAILSVVIIGAWKYFFEAKTAASSNLNERGQNLVGTMGVMEDKTRVRIGDSTWPAMGKDLSPGDTVRVTKVDGIHLNVEKV